MNGNPILNVCCGIKKEKRLHYAKSIREDKLKVHSLFLKDVDIAEIGQGDILGVGVCVRNYSINDKNMETESYVM